MSDLKAVFNLKKIGQRFLKRITATAIGIAIFFPFGQLQAETIWTPSLTLAGIYDDNIQFTRFEPEEDFIYTAQPGLQLNYNQEFTRIYSRGYVYLRRYDSNDELDDEIYRFNLEGKSNITERFRLRGDYEFIKDTTLDAELDEIGRIYSREDRMNHHARLSPTYNLTERFVVGLDGRYRDVSYDSDVKVDYTVWDVGMPFRWLLITQIDSIYVSPGYSYRDSDTNRTDSYNLRIGWDHETTERLKLNFSVGARYTEQENLRSGDTYETWNGLGALLLDYIFQTGKLTLDFQHDLRNTAAGDVVNVTRLRARLRWNFTERMGMDLEGRYFYTRDEREESGESGQYYQLSPELFYQLTENHTIFIVYDYSHDYNDELEEDRNAERNRVWAGIRLNFPFEY